MNPIAGLPFAVTRFHNIRTKSIPDDGVRMTDAGFALTKWYWDCVTPDGRAAIAYRAGLRIRRRAYTFQSLALYERGLELNRRFSASASSAPVVSDSIIRWQASAIGLSARAEGGTPMDNVRLFELEAGALDWHCVAPAAHLCMEIDGGTALHGTGYVECLAMTCAPWRLPIRELGWGRWMDDCATRSLVWIDLRGPQPATWVFLDGRRVCAEVSDDSIRLPEATLALSSRDVLERCTLDDYLAPVPTLARLLPRSFRELGETRWLARGELTGETGWVLHERVVFP